MPSGCGAMTAELDQIAATGAPARIWKSYPTYKDSGAGWQNTQGSKAIINRPQMNAD